jgi:hypothetical protein
MDSYFNFFLLDRINRIFLFFSQFPEETEETTIRLRRKQISCGDMHVIISHR